MRVFHSVIKSFVKQGETQWESKNKQTNTPTNKQTKQMSNIFRVTKCQTWGVFLQLSKLLLFNQKFQKFGFVGWHSESFHGPTTSIHPSYRSLESPLAHTITKNYSSNTVFFLTPLLPIYLILLLSVSMSVPLLVWTRWCRFYSKV